MKQRQRGFIVDPFRFAAPGGSGAAYDAEILADNPYLYWKLDELTGSTVADSSSNGRDGSIVYGGGTAIALGADPVYADGGKSIVSAANAGAYLKGPANPSGFNQYSQFTVEASINLTSLSVDSGVCGWGIGDWGMLMRVQINGSIMFACVLSGSFYGAISAAGLIVPNTPHILAGVLAGGSGGGRSVEAYIDGVSVAFTPAFSTALRQPSGADDAFYAARDVGSAMYGKIDNVACYTSALSAARIAAHYAARAT